MRGLSLLLCVLLSSVASAAVYRWVDETGKVQYSDKPPVGQTKSVTELDKSGRVRKGNEAALSDADRLAAEEKKQKELDQRRRDKSLLQSFSKPEEIDLLRDRQIDAVESGKQTNTLRRNAALKRMEKQNQQVEVLKKQKRPITADLLAEIDVSKKEIADIDAAIAKQNQDIEQIKQKAVADKVRLNELKAVKPN